MHRPKRIVTTDEAIYDAVMAELRVINDGYACRDGEGLSGGPSARDDEATMATHAHNVITRLKEEKELQKASANIEFKDEFPTDDDIDNEIIHNDEERFAGKVSDITGFPEDDDEAIYSAAHHNVEVAKRRRIPGIPKANLP